MSKAGTQAMRSRKRLVAGPGPTGADSTPGRTGSTFRSDSEMAHRAQTMAMAIQNAAAVNSGRQSYGTGADGMEIFSGCCMKLSQTAAEAASKIGRAHV